MAERSVFRQWEYKMWGNGVALPCVWFVLCGIVWMHSPAAIMRRYNLHRKCEDIAG